MPLTLLPFLYSTRTLIASRTSIAHTRKIHSSLRLCAREHDDYKSTRYEYQPRERRSSSRPHEYERKDHPNRPPSKKPLMPRLRHSGNTDGGFGINRITTPKTDNRETSFDGIPFNFPDQSDWAASDSNLQEIEDLTRVSGENSMEKGTTITVAERHAFQRIFEDIFKRQHQFPDFDPDGTVSVPDPVEKAKVEADARSAQDRLETVLGKVRATDVNRREQKREEIQKAVSRFPASLRDAAAKAMGLTEEPTPKAKKEVSKPDPYEVLREPERQRVEGLMRNAETDFELWAVMDKEVFPLIDRMRLRERHVEVVRAMKTNKTTKKTKRSKKDTLRAAEEMVALPIEDEQTKAVREEEDAETRHQLNLFGPLYPAYLLLGLRLLDREFAKPSPLVFSILPRIKSMGIISHVLGASTALYNELIRINFLRHDNFEEVVKLLTEMEEAGLNHDTETLEIVTNISNTQIHNKKGRQGHTLKALWSMPEFTPDEFDRWVQKIQRNISESRYLASQSTDF